MSRVALATGSAFASLFNFYAFIILPSLVGTEALETFARDNYVGGAYLFGIGSSIAPFTVFALRDGRWPALTRYIAICAVGLLAASTAGIWGAGWPWSHACIAAAMCIQLAGFCIAALIQEQRLYVVALTQFVQPCAFASLITITYCRGDPGTRWAQHYLISAVIGLVVLLAVTDWAAIKQRLSAAGEGVLGWAEVPKRMLLAVSFPIFFQTEVILCGTTTDADLGLYVMLQKLYSSIAISLFSSLAVLVVSREMGATNRRAPIVTRYSLMMAVIGALCIMLVGLMVVAMGKGAALTSGLVAQGAVVGALFTLCTFVGTRLAIVQPRSGLGAFAAALAVYLVAFWVSRPSTLEGMLVAAGLFYCAYLGSASLLTRRIE